MLTQVSTHHTPLSSNTQDPAPKATQVPPKMVIHAMDDGALYELQPEWTGTRTSSPTVMNTLYERVRALGLQEGDHVLIRNHKQVGLEVRFPVHSGCNS